MGVMTQRHDPLELPLAGHSEGSVTVCLGLQDHLPESCREVDGGEECASGLPISSMHSWTSFMEYLSSRDLVFRARKSWTSCREPFFFMTQNNGLLNLDLQG